MRCFVAALWTAFTLGLGAATATEYYQSDSVCHLSWTEASPSPFVQGMKYWDMRASVDSLERAYPVPDIHPDQRNW